MKLRTVMVNKTEGYRFGDEVIDEKDMRMDLREDKGHLFRFLQREYGRCVSKIYSEFPMGDGTYLTVTHGWVFEKKMQYTDCRKTYLQETWVSIEG